VAAARGRHPEPPLPVHGGVARPHIRLVWDPQPLPSPVSGVLQNARKMRITSAFAGKYLATPRQPRQQPAGSEADQKRGHTRDDWPDDAREEQEPLVLAGSGWRQGVEDRPARQPERTQRGGPRDT